MSEIPKTWEEWEKGLGSLVIHLPSNGIHESPTAQRKRIARTAFNAGIRAGIALAMERLTAVAKGSGLDPGPGAQ